MLKHKDRLDFHPRITDAVLDVPDACHKFIVEIVFIIFIQKLLNAW